MSAAIPQWTMNDPRPECGPSPRQPRLPLYLTANARCSVSALSGGCGVLVLHSPRLAERKFPIDRVSRILSATHHDWNGSAIALCLSSGVPVVFFSQGSGPAGWLFPAAHTPGRLTHLIDEFLSRPDWHRLYSNWLRSERNRAINTWTRPADPSQPAPTQRQQDASRKRFVYQSAEVQIRIPALWRDAAITLVLRLLSLAGLYPSYTACDAQTLALASDCTDLACLHLFPLLNQTLSPAAVDSGRQAML